jgi:hypothetical protein
MITAVIFFIIGWWAKKAQVAIKNDDRILPRI